MTSRCSIEEQQFYKEIGEKLRIIRNFKSFSQEKLANELNLTFQQIQKYERGTNRIPLTKLLRACKILDVNLSYFVEDESNNSLFDSKDLELISLIERQLGKENLFEFLQKIKSHNSFKHCIPELPEPK